MIVLTELEMLRGDGRKQAVFCSDVAWKFGLSVIWEFPKIRDPQYSTLDSRILIIRTPK